MLPHKLDPDFCWQIQPNILIPIQENGLTKNTQYEPPHPHTKTHMLR